MRIHSPKTPSSSNQNPERPFCKSADRRHSVKKLTIAVSDSLRKKVAGQLEAEHEQGDLIVRNAASAYEPGIEVHSSQEDIEAGGAKGYKSKICMKDPGNDQKTCTKLVMKHFSPDQDKHKSDLRRAKDAGNGAHYLTAPVRYANHEHHQVGKVSAAEADQLMPLERDRGVNHARVNHEERKVEYLLVGKKSC